MRKITEGAKERNWAALEKLVEARDDIAMKVMREIFARLPYGQEFTLSDGSVAYLSKRPKSVGRVAIRAHGHRGPSRSGERADHPRNDKSLAAKSGRQ